MHRSSSRRPSWNGSSSTAPTKSLTQLTRPSCRRRYQTARLKGTLLVCHRSSGCIIVPLRSLCTHAAPQAALEQQLNDVVRELETAKAAADRVGVEGTKQNVSPWLSHPAKQIVLCELLVAGLQEPPAMATLFHCCTPTSHRACCMPKSRSWRPPATQRCRASKVPSQELCRQRRPSLLQRCARTSRTT